MENLHEGQIVYLKPMNHKQKAGYTEAQLGRVILSGRKFITVEANNWFYKFDNKTLNQVVKKGELRDYQLFFTRKEYEEFEEWNRRYDEIKTAIPNKKRCTLSLEQMRKICDVIRGKI